MVSIYSNAGAQPKCNLQPPIEKRSIKGQDVIYQLMCEYKESLPGLSYIAIAKDQLHEGDFYLVISSDEARLKRVKIILPDYGQLRNFYTYKERFITHQSMKMYVSLKIKISPQMDLFEIVEHIKDRYGLLLEMMQLCD